MNEEKSAKTKEVYSQWLSDISSGKIQLVVLESKELKALIGTASAVSTQNGYDTEAEKRLVREDNVIYHPRTKEKILGCSNDKLPKISKEHLNRCPRTAYHRNINAKQVSGKFLVQKRTVEIGSPLATAYLKYVLNGQLIYQATQQYKTIWTKGKGSYVSKKQIEAHQRPRFLPPQ